MSPHIRGTLPLPVRRIFRKLGSDIRDARRRRRIRASTMAERALISRTTLHETERGDAGVSMGMYATILFVLGMHDGISDLADRTRDGIGLDLLEERLPQRVHCLFCERAREAATPEIRNPRRFPGGERWPRDSVGTGGKSIASNRPSNTRIWRGLSALAPGDDQP